MRILIIDGSPRKGNTWKLTQKVMDILLTYDNTINFTEVHLSDLNLPFESTVTEYVITQDFV